MTAQKFLTPNKLVEYLDCEVKEALLSHGVRRLFDYAWLDAETPDDRYIGLAKWSIDGVQYKEHDEDSTGYSRRDHTAICVAVTDLEALMDLAAIAIGQSLWVTDIAKADQFKENPYFWLNHISSLTLLGMASDRLLELFVVVFFQMSHADYKRSKKRAKKLDNNTLEPHHFQYPFADALEQVRKNPLSTNIAEPVIKLREVANRLYQFRDHRNTVVHDVATREAKLMARYLDSGPRAEELRLTMVNQETPECLQGGFVTEHVEAIDGATADSMEWYDELVYAASYVFDIEHSFRAGGRVVAVE